jgi:7,8-dihydropterin-6-yl-methyl-4-(beta-D-ribofuranosyl)aminobenzene 5'-phosphate synthase
VKLVTLVEDSQRDLSLGSEHGVSFYTETNEHKLLFDVGQTDLYALNASKLGIDINDVDTVVISHGHYDHGGGLEHFLSINDHATIYIQKTAFAELYSMRNPNEYTYIGLNQKLDRSRFSLFEGDLRIDEELMLFSRVENKDLFPTSNQTLYQKKGDQLIADNFDHEQNLLVNTNSGHVLFAGCAHKGIVNIINQAERFINGNKINAVFGGFHLISRYEEFEESKENIEKIAYLLQTKQIDKYYTGHCTGSIALTIMNGILHERLQRFYPGLQVEV